MQPISAAKALVRVDTQMIIFELVQPHTKYIVIGFLDYTEHTGTVRIITLVCNKCITLTSTLRELPNKLKLLK